MIINRHGYFDPSEVSRTLKEGGSFITQQVGGNDCIGLNKMLSAPKPDDYSDWDIATAVQPLQQLGLEVVEKIDAYPITRFFDGGAIVYYLTVIEW